MTRVEERPEWRSWVTPRPLKNKPIHRWYFFPHSFTSELVDGLIDEWGLTPSDAILDPFVGAGTTLLTAKANAIPAAGYDLSPLAAFVTRVKLQDYDPACLKSACTHLSSKLPLDWEKPSKVYPALVRKALPGRLLQAFDLINQRIEDARITREARDFFKLALINTIPLYSHAEATGGWLRWRPNCTDPSTVASAWLRRAESMITDIREDNSDLPGKIKVDIADARSLPEEEECYSAVITSPPYPNRHDYTRVFGVELMFSFLDWEETKKLRYQSFHSHPEAHPERGDLTGYSEPARLTNLVERLRAQKTRRRLRNMLKGYFEDMFLFLTEMNRVCKPSARVGCVVGNVRYNGLVIPVDEFTAEIGEQIGFDCERLIAVRFRGNSAQQMGTFGREPSRESIVVLRRRPSGARLP